MPMLESIKSSLFGWVRKTSKDADDLESNLFDRVQEDSLLK